jgi:hypothetical protein
MSSAERLHRNEVIMHDQSTPDRPDYQDRVVRAFDTDRRQQAMLSSLYDHFTGPMIEVQRNPRFVEGSVSMGGTSVRVMDPDGGVHVITSHEVMELVRVREMRRAG